MAVNNGTVVWVMRLRLLEEKRIACLQLFGFTQRVVTLHDDASTWWIDRPTCPLRAQFASMCTRATQAVSLVNLLPLYASSKHTCTCPTFCSRVSCVGHSYRRSKHTSLSHRKPTSAATGESDERDTQSTNRDPLKSVLSVLMLLPYLSV